MILSFFLDDHHEVCTPLRNSPQTPITLGRTEVGRHPNLEIAVMRDDELAGSSVPADTRNNPEIESATKDVMPTAVVLNELVSSSGPNAILKPSEANPQVDNMKPTEAPGGPVGSFIPPDATATTGDLTSSSIPADAANVMLTAEAPSGPDDSPHPSTNSVPLTGFVTAEVTAPQT